MSFKNFFYLTTTLPYVNADPHIGFALEITQADALARYHRLLGEEVVFNTGTDEHGLKIYRKALENNEAPQAFCDRHASKFDALKQALNLSYTNFIRTTDPHHIKAAQEFWRRCFANGDIYKKSYRIKYCVGCELEKTDSELVDGDCPAHPNLDIEFIEEENYFFRFSKYEGQLLELYEKQKDFVVPANRLREIINFVECGLADFSISRLKAKMPWGIQVPNDDDHVMYVWFDALINYISTLGWPDSALRATPGKPDLFTRFWPGVQVAGKDNLRQQSAMWQAMLMSAGLPPSKQIFIHGFITSDGQKMSKSLGNVVDPFALVEKYGTDAVRFFLLGGLPPDDDGDFTVERFEKFYIAHLVNGIGNLTSRVLTMMEKYCDSRVPYGKAEDIGHRNEEFWKKYNAYFSEYKFDEIVKLINALVAELDTLISEEKPWEKAKNGEDISGLLYELAESLRQIALALLPIIPNTAEKILSQLGIKMNKLGGLEKEQKWGGLKPGTKIKKGGILFPRLV
ncbi:MAG: methionine--tRNA ligase [Candidatus Magasanikbacteria bacterium]|nr:methionine--tRNA ligase [Candidatus Magasanikbacteria bacterium]